MSNITKISLRGKTVVDSKPLYQYDYGQKIRFIGVSLPAAYEVHFSNYEQGESVTVLATSDEVDIPDFLLQSGYDIYVWVYIHTGVSDGETEYQITIPVIERARPTNQEPTPQEQDIITETIAALNDAVTEARDIAEDVTEKDEHVTQLYTYMNNTKNEVYQYKEDAEAAATLLKNVSANAETLPPSSDATATYSSGVFNFGIPKGEPGKNFVIQKYVATVEDLPENVEVGTVYGVGTSQPYSIYVFSENLGWVDNGFVQGPQGLPGEKGESAGFGTPTVTVNQTIGQPYASISTRGPDTAKIFDFAFSGLKGEKGDTGNGISSAELNNDYTLTLNYTDGTSYTTEESIRGDTGENGTTYMPSLTSDGTLSWSNDGGKINPRSVNIKGPQGERGPAGEGVPTGGSAGQVLKKASATDYDTEWGDSESNKGAMIVTFTKVGDTLVADKTFEEVYTAYTNGTLVVARKGGCTYLPRQALPTSFYFTCFDDVINSNVKQYNIYFSNTNISESSSTISPLQPRDFYEINVYCDGEMAYQDPPTGNLTAFGDRTLYEYALHWSYIPSTVILVYGDDRQWGSVPTIQEQYNLSFVNTESRYYEEWGTNRLYYFLHFRTIGCRNGTALFKEFVVEGFEDSVPGQATVTYSEIAL